MLIVAVAGLPVNIIMYFILHTGAHSHGLMADDCGGVDDENAYTSMCVDIIC
jgi:Co/Zn/Cd efflux system component